MIDINFNDINNKSVEGKLLIASMAIITTELYGDKTPYFSFDKIKKLSNMIFFQEEVTFVDGLKKYITDNLHKNYYNDNILVMDGDSTDIPKVILDKIDDKVIDLINSLKEFGLFSGDSPYIRETMSNIRNQKIDTII